MENTGQQGSGAGSSPRPQGRGVSLANRFELEQRIGCSAVGSSWLARDVTSARPCLVRFGDAPGADHRLIAADFAVEGAAAARIRSEYVLSILAHGDHEGVPYIVQELLVGESLEQRVQHTGPVPPPSVLRYISEAASALGRAHGVGLVHGCLTPSRIFLARSSGRDLVKLLDFGRVQVGQRGDRPRSVSEQITVSSSPEQLTAGAVTDLSDVWALGVVTFFALTGRLPFPAQERTELAHEILAAPIPSPLELNPTLSAAIAQWLEYALERKPGERFRTPSELAVTLAHAAGLPPHEVGARPPPSSTRGRHTSGPAAAAPRLERLQSPGSWSTTPASAPAATPRALAGRPGKQSVPARPALSLPPSKRTMVGVGTAAPPRAPAQEPRKPSTIRGMAAVGSAPPKDFNRTVLGVGGGGTAQGRSEALYAQSGSGGSEARAPNSSHPPRTQTMIGVGSRPLPAGAPGRAPPTEPWDDAVQSLGQRTLPGHSANGMLIDVRGGDLRRTLGGIGQDPELRDAIRRGLGRSATGDGAGATILPDPERRTLANDPQSAVTAQGRAFFVPRQSTLLGVVAQDAEELAVAREVDRQRRTPVNPEAGTVPGNSGNIAPFPTATDERPDLDDSDSFLVAPASHGPSTKSGVVGGYLADGGAPRTTLKPAPTSQRHPAPEPRTANAGAEPSRKSGSAEAHVKLTLSRTRRSQADSTGSVPASEALSPVWLPPEAPLSPPSHDGERTPRAAVQETVWDSASGAEPSGLESVAPSALARELLRKRKVLIVVVASVVGLMLALLGGALLSQQLRSERAPAAEKGVAEVSGSGTDAPTPIPPDSSTPPLRTSTRSPPSTETATQPAVGKAAGARTTADHTDAVEFRGRRASESQPSHATSEPAPSPEPAPERAPTDAQGAPNYGI